MKKLLLTLSLALAATTTFAQRVTDKLDRGLVAIPANGSGNFVSWRIFGEEYYDVTYNLYRNGTKIASNLKTSNYSDASGNNSSTYQVAAVVRGVEQEKCEAVKRWSQQYFDIPVKPIIDRNGKDATADYQLNDISLADLNGDGVTEFIVKRPCNVAWNVSQKARFHVIDCYDIKGNRLWWIDLGPNMLSGPDEQWDAVAYDWDGDGKAEVLLRGQDNMIIHHADGTTTEIGSKSVDTRWDGIEYTSSGNEYLLYLEGQTAKPYQIGPAAHPNYMTYPLTRGQDSDWGTGIVGHRSTKHYFGAPCLDGRKSSIFLGRGAYTKHKMAAYDVDPATHQLTQRWYWECNVGGPWFGQGYHNYAISDVDWDGRDEIMFGSMVIDDNGKGLSTTGLGHGDAQHCADFDPYRWGQEQFTCNENAPNMNYRNATTSEFYFRSIGTSDDGRGLMGNFSNTYPGSLGRSVNTGMISSVADKIIPDAPGIDWSDLSFRIYWDGDLCDEVLDSPGSEAREFKIEKPGVGRLDIAGAKTAPGSATCNSSKNNPCATGDIFGDWREELVARTSDNKNIRIYATAYPTTFRVYTLWHDHQYRNAMVWQSMGYNQPPHKSYFLGEMEGITVAPPPLTMTGRTEVANGGTITSEDKHFIVCEPNDTKITIADGASPYMVTFNVPSWVQGTAGNNSTAKQPKINYTYYKCEVSGGALAGETRLVKQGDGILTLPKVDMTHSGETNIWAGTLNFDGTMKQSPLWLNRFAELNSNGGVFKSIKADYASVIRPGGADSKGSITVNEELKLGFGSRLIIDLYPEDMTSDQINTQKLTIEKKSWKYGPAYMRPVIQFVLHGNAAEGKYLLGNCTEVSGNLSDIIIEGADAKMRNALAVEDGKLYLIVEGTREATDIFWSGAVSKEWNVALTDNFIIGQEAGQIYVNGDNVTFDDNATSFTVSINQSIEPGSVTFANESKAYVVNGSGGLDGKMSLTKEGSASVTISNDNSYTGGNHLNGGTVKVSSLAFSTQAKGNLGGVTTAADAFTMSNGAVLNTTAHVTQGSPMKMVGPQGGIINNAADFKTEKSISGTILTKRGNGWFFDYNANPSLDTVRVEAGTFVIHGHNNPAKNIVLAGGTVNDDNCSSAKPIISLKGKKSTFNMGASASKTAYTNKLTGEGEVTMHIGKHPNYDGVYRTAVQMNWSAFEGTVKLSTVNDKNAFPLDNSYGIPKGTLNIGNTITVVNTGKTFKIGALTGAGTLGGPVLFAQGAASGTNTWQVGSLNSDFTFEGKISANSVFEKIGDGKMNTKGVWDNTGAVKITAGELHLNTGSTLGTGTLTVGANGTLSGTTKTGVPLTNSSFTINGTLQVGATASSPSGTMDFNGKRVTFGTSSRLVLGLRTAVTDDSKASGASIKNISTLTINGTIAPFLYESYVPTEGDVLRLWTDVNTVTGTPKANLPETHTDKDGNIYSLTWDTSEIAKGIIKIASVGVADNITDIPAGEEVKVEVFTLSGTLACTYYCQMSAVQSVFAQSTALDRGPYVLRISSKNLQKTLKVTK